MFVLLAWSLLLLGSGGCTSEPEETPLPKAAPNTAKTPSPDGDGGVEEPLISCGRESCKAPAFCAGDPKRCYCPPGYRDVAGDGSRCEDWDECELAPGACGHGATCINTPGGYRCDCAAPTHRAEGRYCVCAEGYTQSADGLCLAKDGRECSDNLDCLNNHCESGICCAQSCNRPGQCHTSENATCADGKTCEYPAAPDGTACDDARACTRDTACREGQCSKGEPLDCDDGNPCTDDSCEEPIGCKNKNNSAACDDTDICTVEDHCNAGECRGNAKNCSAQDDGCNAGVCDAKSGACKKQPLEDGTFCDDGNSCSQDDSCAAGSCTGHRNACGPNGLTCSPGSANQCTCRDGFVDAQGVCIPLNNECAAINACSADANCFDPSNTLGDVECTCKPGYAGNGADCMPVEPCQNNPCGEGRGSCSVSAPGRYSCACDPGYVAVGGTCVCDMSGTFAVRTRLDLSWERMANAIEAGSDTVYSYGLQRHSYDSAGNLQLELQACGDSELDFCGIGIAPVLAAEAYAQFMSVHIWDLPSMPRVHARVNLPKALPGAPFETEIINLMRGISLRDPAGAWPTSYRDISGAPDFDGTAVNGATWLDHDADDVIGVSTYIVPPGGIPVDGKVPDPARSYGALSPICPRNGGPHTPYAYWPAPTFGDSTPPIRVTRMYTASRITSAYKGKMISCDEYSGNIVGPDNGRIKLEARIGGCVRTTGSSETACASPSIDFIDQAAQNHNVVSATFLIKRLPRTATPSCALVRNFDFD